MEITVLDETVNMDWNLVWGIIKDVVLPHSGTLIFNVILFLFIGLLLSTSYSVILSKKKVLKRAPKYYNWAVKLYIPIIIAVFLYFFGQIGFIRGIYKILDNEKESIVTSVYEKTLSYAFESEESKNNFLEYIQESAKKAKDGSVDLVAVIQKETQNYNSGISIIDEGKDKISNYLIDKYGNDIYTIGLYGMMNLASVGASAANIKTGIDQEIPSYSEFSTAVDFLLDVGYRDIELAIKDHLIKWFTTLLDSQYASMIKIHLIILLFVIILPLIEFYIYKKWILPTLTK